RHDRGVPCLGRAHAGAALSGVDPACGICASFTLAKATKRLALWECVDAERAAPAPSGCCRFSQAPQSNVSTPAPDGAVPRHACATSPAMHTVQSHPPIFFKTMRGQPQISSPSLGGVGADLGLDSLTMSRLVPDQFNSKPSLAGFAASWRACAVSPWVLRTITKEYVLQFARPPPPFSGVIQSVVQQGKSHFLREEIVSLLKKEAISIVPPEEEASGFYSRYFLVPKKDGNYRPILDLRVLNKALMPLR